MAGRTLFSKKSGSNVVEINGMKFTLPQVSGVSFSNESKNALFSKMVINGAEYSMNDAKSVESMPVGMREHFWSSCSDEAKNSDLYRDYAKNQLAEVKLDPSKIDNEKIRLSVINNAVAVKNIGKFFIEKKSDNWFGELLSLPQDQFIYWISQGGGLLNLITGLDKTGYMNLLDLLKKLNIANPEYFNVLLRNSYASQQILIEFHSLDYADPLTHILTLELKSLALVVNNQYAAISILKCFKELEYENPLEVWRTTKQDTLELFCASSIGTIALLKFIGSENPVGKLASIASNKLKKLLNNYFNAIELMKIFSQFKYSTQPLKALLDLNPEVEVLFFENTFQLKSIVQALYNKEKENPIEFLMSLGVSAMKTILNNYYEYQNRIQRGVKLDEEFKPIVAPKHAVAVGNKFKVGMQLFFDQMMDRKESNVEAAARLSIEAASLTRFQDSTTKEIANIPVTLDGSLYDCLHLIGLPEDNSGYRKDPLTGEKFLLRDIQPAKDQQHEYDEMIAKTPPKLTIAGPKR